MKFLHTSDLHIGLRLCEVSLNREITDILGQITEIAAAEGCDAVVIAGDIYDRANPTGEASGIFDDFVTGLARRKIAVLAAAGNHDSPEKVAYLSRLTEESGVYVAGAFDGTVRRVKLGDVSFWLLPFVRPVNVRSAGCGFEGNTYHDAVAAILAGLELNSGEKNVLVTHQFVVPGCAGEKMPEDAESHAIAGGIGAVGADLFGLFDYTALGHLHRPHFVGSERVNYSGSPIKCSFSEADDEKSVTVVDLSEGVACRRIPLRPERDLREMRGSYEEILSPEYRSLGKTEDYLRIVLTDEEDIPDAVAKLRTVYPNLMRLGYDNLRTRASVVIAPEADEGEETPEEIFSGLYEMQNNAPPSEELMDLVRDLFEEARKEAEE